MTRLVHMAAYKPEQRGSFVPFVLAVLMAARDRGWNVEAVFPEQARGRFWLSDFRDAGIPVTLMSGSRRSLTRWLDDRLGEGVEPTILHTHFTRYDVPAALAARRRSNAYVYWHIHTVLSTRPRVVAANAAKFSLLGRYVDRILSPAADVAESVVRRFGNREKVTVFPNTIDPSAFPVLSTEQRSMFRRELGVPEKAYVLLHFGRDWHLKGGKVFLDALANLAAMGLPVFALFSRAGAEAEGYIESRGLRDRVKTVDLRPDPQALYGAADVLVAPSLGETMPFTVIESLCSGTPVVASDLAGHRFLGDALDACVVVPREAEPVAAATRSLLELAPTERARLCRDAREWIVDRLDVRVAAERLMDDYVATVEGRSGPGRRMALTRWQ